MAALRTISFEQLMKNEAVAVSDLNEAAQRQGFFYLDLQNVHTEHIVQDIQACMDAASQFFDLPLSDKLKYDIDKLGSHKLNGYKPAGRNQGISKDKKDGFEAYLVPRDGVCNDLPNDETVPLPFNLAMRKQLLRKVMDDLHEVGRTVMSALSCDADPSLGVNLAHSHRHDKPSTSALGILKYPQLWQEGLELGHGAHTDVGSLTLLFCSAPGLQILEPTTNQWMFVETRPRHAIVNIGDSLRFLSKGAYRSCLHRVMPYKDAKIADRYSCAYFMRPELDAMLEDDEGHSWSSIAWHDRKYSAFQATLEKQKESSVLTGTDGYIGLWQAETEQHHKPVVPIS